MDDEPRDPAEAEAPLTARKTAQQGARKPRAARRSFTQPRPLGKPTVASLPRLVPFALLKIFALAILACFAAFWVLLHRIHARSEKPMVPQQIAFSTPTGEVWVDLEPEPVPTGASSATSGASTQPSSAATLPPAATATQTQP